MRPLCLYHYPTKIHLLIFPKKINSMFRHLFISCCKSAKSNLELDAIWLLSKFYPAASQEEKKIELHLGSLWFANAFWSITCITEAWWEVTLLLFLKESQPLGPFSISGLNWCVVGWECVTRKTSSLSQKAFLEHFFMQSRVTKKATSEITQRN